MNSDNLPSLRLGFVSLFPEVIETYMESSVIGKAVDAGLAEVQVASPRDFAYDRHRTVDDSPYGGFPGMLLKAEPVALAAESLHLSSDAVWLITDPTGEPFTQSLAMQLSEFSEIGIFCGHYEGIDQRLPDYFNARSITIGPYILTGGELPALVMADSIIRLKPGVLGNQESLEFDSFAEQWSGRKSPPNYTKPAVWRGIMVPDVLVSGNHAQVDKWAKEQSRIASQEED